MNSKFLKRFISTALSAMLIFSCLTVPALANEASADEQLKAEVKAELDATAKAMCDYIKDKISDEQSALDSNDIKNYALILKAGYSDETVTDELLKFIKDMIDDTQNPISATYTDYSGSIALSNNYPYIITFLNEAGENSSDFNGYNFNSALEAAYLNETVTVNPYLEQYIISAVSFNKEAFSQPEKIIEKAEKAISDICTTDANGGTGIDYWGVSADNNGQCLVVLKSLYNTDTEIKEKVDNSLAWTAAQLSDNGEIISWGSPNPSSTALAIKAFSEFNDLDKALTAFKGMASFKSSTIDGVYEAYSYTSGVVEADYSFATPDALMGLLSYYRALCGNETLEVIVSNADTDINNNTNNDTNNNGNTDENNTDNKGSDNTSADENNQPEETTTAAPAKETPNTADVSSVAAIAAVLLLSGAVYLGFNKKNA